MQGYIFIGDDAEFSIGNYLVMRVTIDCDNDGFNKPRGWFGFDGEFHLEMLDGSGILATYKVLFLR